MAASDETNVPSLSKWHIALAIGIGAPLAIGAGYWYYQRHKNKKGDKPAPKKSKSNASSDFSSVPIDIASLRNTGPENGKLANPESPQEKAKAFKNQGNKFYKEGAFDKAIECYTNAIGICPEDAKSDIATFYQNRAAAYEMLKNYSQVIIDCTKSLEFNKNYIKALHRRAKAYEIVENLQQSLEDLTMLCILEQFQSASSLQMTDRVLKNLSKTQAKEIFMGRPPRLPSKHYVRHYFISFSEDPVMKSVEEYKKNMQEKKGELNGYRAAIHNLALEEYDEVISNATTEIARDGPDKAEALLIRGTFKLLQGQIAVAEADFQQLLSMESVDVKVRVNALIKMGALNVQIEKMEESLDFFSKAAELDLNNADIYLHRGQVSLLMDRIGDALKDMEKSVSLNPNFPCAIAQKCFIQHRCGMHFNDESQKKAALRGFEEVTTKFPQCSESSFLYAQILNELEEYEKSDKFFLKAGELDPNDPNVYVHRGLLVCQWKQDVDACVELLNKAIQMDPKCHFGLEALGSLEIQRGNLKEGLELFNRAVDICNTENELAHLLSLLKAAEAQAKAVQILGIPIGQPFFNMDS